MPVLGHVDSEVSMFLRPYEPTSDRQQWVLSGEHIHLRHDSKFVFDIQKRQTHRGANVLGFRANGQRNQRWYVKECNESLRTRQLEKNSRKITMAPYEIECSYFRSLP